MLAFLIACGWFILTFLLTSIAILILYCLFMSTWGYRWSAYSVERYLSSHGRGNFDNENEYITGVDVITRLIWVGVFTVVGIVVGTIIVPAERYLICAVVLGAGAFALLCVKIELCFVIRIGRLKGIDKQSKKAFFVNMKNEVFEYYYEDNLGAEDDFVENKKYIVVDYYSFSMVEPVDDYE